MIVSNIFESFCNIGLELSLTKDKITLSPAPLGWNEESQTVPKGYVMTTTRMSGETKGKRKGRGRGWGRNGLGKLKLGKRVAINEGWDGA